MNYNVSAASPVGELLTLGHILSDVGNYASTVFDGEHQSLSHECGKKLTTVVSELKARNRIISADDLYYLSDEPINCEATALTASTVTELYGLYRQWPLRHQERRAKGREHFTFYHEGHIVSELLRRKVANTDEQFKIDYCVATYRNELDNMSFVFSRPVQADSTKIHPVKDRAHTPEELTALIRLYSDYRDIIERELLVEYVDYALDLLEQDKDANSCLGLLTEIAEAKRRQIIRIPEWVNKRLEDAINMALHSKTRHDAELPAAMLTLQSTNGDSTLEREAQRIINRCYKSAFDESAQLSERIENLHTAVTSCDYVTRFSIRKAATLWNDLVVTSTTSGICLTPKQIFQLLEVAKECEAYAPISFEAQDQLKRQLSQIAHSASIVAKAYDRLIGTGS